MTGRKHRSDWAKRDRTRARNDGTSRAGHGPLYQPWRAPVASIHKAGKAPDISGGAPLMSTHMSEGSEGMSMNLVVDVRVDRAAVVVLAVVIVAVVVIVVVVGGVVVVIVVVVLRPDAVGAGAGAHAHDQQNVVIVTVSAAVVVAVVVVVVVVRYPWSISKAIEITLGVVRKLAAAVVVGVVIVVVVGMSLRRVLRLLDKPPHKPHVAGHSPRKPVANWFRAVEFEWQGPSHIGDE